MAWRQSFFLGGGSDAIFFFEREEARTLSFFLEEARTLSIDAIFIRAGLYRGPDGKEQSLSGYFIEAWLECSYIGPLACALKTEHGPRSRSV